MIPVLLLLATTGLIYLFRFQIEPLLHADLMKVDQPADQIAQPYAAQQAAVGRELPDNTIVSMTEPSEAGRSTMFSTVAPDGAAEDVYVNPYGAEVLGSLDPDTTLSGYAVRLHGELMAGPWGDYVIELGACWAVVMAISGYYLFFRGWRARRRARASRVPGARLRHRHGVVGAFVGRRAAAPAGVRAALDRPLGREGAGAGHRPRLVAVEHRPGRGRPTRPRRSTSRCRTATRTRCPGGMGESEVPHARSRGRSAASRTSTPPSRSPTARGSGTR